MFVLASGLIMQLTCLICGPIKRNPLLVQTWTCARRTFVAATCLTSPDFSCFLLTFVVFVLTQIALCNYHLIALNVITLPMRERCKKGKFQLGTVDNERPHSGLSVGERVSIASLLLTYISTETYLYYPSKGQRI